MALLSPFAVAQGRFVVMGPPGTLLSRICDSVCSLPGNEFVAVDRLLEGEVARNSPLGAVVARARRHGVAVPDDAVMQVLRHWFWSLRSGRGFVLAGFPATAVQAVVFDAWMEERDSCLSGAIWIDQSFDQAVAAAATGDARRRSESWFAVQAPGVRQAAGHYRQQGNLVRVDGALSEDEALNQLSEQLSGLVADR
jgi:adenylate kinase family enzyme